MLDRVIVPARLALIFRSGKTVGYNPGLNTWERLDDETAEVLRWLRAGRERGQLVPHLVRRFAYQPTEASQRLKRLLGWCVLHRMLYLDAEPLLPAIDHGASPLETVYWISTQACNLRCTYCYQDASKKRPQELSTEEAQDLITQTAEAGVKTFIFTGGEPFVRRDLLHLARFSRTCGLYTNVITNGSYITRKNIDEIAEIFHNVTISVDGVMESHDRSRGRGSWARAVNAIELLIEAGVSVDINSVLTKFGLRDVKELLTLVRGWTIGQHRILPQFPMGRATRFSDDELTEDEILALGDYLHEEARILAAKAKTSYALEGSYSSKMTRRNHCGAGLSEISVDPEGWVYPCRLLQYGDFKTHNIRDHRLIDIFDKHPTLRTIRARVADTLHPCKTCVIKNHCGGGCRGIHFSHTHEYIQANPLFCAYLRNIFEISAWSSTGEVPPVRRVHFAKAPKGSGALLEGLARPM
jgi:radical SAM protein with 4Fe4S-binding SPASM domain